MIDVDALKARVNLAEVVGHYSALQKRGKEYVGRCVWHSPDDHPSMWVTQKGFVHCFACGANADVIGFIQHVEGCDFQHACELLGGSQEWSPSISLPPRIERPNRITSKPPQSRLLPDMSIRGTGEPSTVWTYYDAVGDVLGYLARYDCDDGSKEFRPWTWGARGDERPEWACGHWSRPRPLYGLDRLAGKPDAPVILVEGEKAADAAAALLPAYAVISWPGGAEAWDRADWLPVAGRTVLLWPDADPPGVKAMARIADLLSDPDGLGCTVSVLDVEGMPEGSDAADFTGDTAALIAWAKPRKRAYERRTAPPRAAEPEPPEDTGDNPPPPPASIAAATRPARRRPQLSVVGIDDEGSAARQLDAPLPLELSESGIADEFAGANQADMRFVPEWQKHGWLVWNGARWVREAKRVTAMQRVKDLAYSLKYRKAGEHLQPASKNRMESKPFLWNVLDLAESDRRLLATPQQWDANPFLLGVPDGVIDLRTGDMAEPTPEDYITRQTAVAPVEGDTPLFDRVIAQAAGGDAAMLSYLWRWLGYCLSGSVQEECFVFLYGPPGCGKTTLVEAVADIMGDVHAGGYAVKTALDHFIESKFERGAGKLHILHGARFAHAAETEEGRHWKPAMMKEATGGDTLIGERKYENEFSFRPTHKLLIHGNYRPHMRQADEGLRRRMQIVEYHAAIAKDERDLTLKQRLKAEYPAILFRMIAACLEWQRDGLKPPPPVTAAVDEYYDAEDSFGDWIKSCITRKIGARMSSTAAYTNYRVWLEDRGEHSPSHKRFAGMMQSREFSIIKSGGVKFFKDAELALPDVPPYDFRD